MLFHCEFFFFLPWVWMIIRQRVIKKHKLELKDMDFLLCPVMGPMHAVMFREKMKQERSYRERFQGVSVYYLPFKAQW